MPRNIDKTTAPQITLVPETRNFEVVQGDNRALFGIRFRDRISTTEAPVYDPIHASEWAGHVLRSRGGTQNAPLQFNNVNFSYTSGNDLLFSNREVQVHIPWENAMLSTDMVNPPPNRPVNLLYDIWQVTYPDATDSYIGADGDRPYYTRDNSDIGNFEEIQRLTSNSVRITAPSSAPTQFNANIGDIGLLLFRFDGRTEDNYIIGRVISRNLTGQQHLDLEVLTFTNGGETTEVPSSYGGSVQSTSTYQGLNITTNTALSQVRFRGTIAVRERIYDNTHAGNEDTPTNGG